MIRIEDRRLSRAESRELFTALQAVGGPQDETLASIKEAVRLSVVAWDAAAVSDADAVAIYNLGLTVSCDASMMYGEPVEDEQWPGRPKGRKGWRCTLATGHASAEHIACGPGTGGVQVLLRQPAVAQETES